MARADGVSTRIPCPGRPACRGTLRLIHDDEDSLVMSCPRCGGQEYASVYALTGQLRHQAAAR